MSAERPTRDEITQGMTVRVQQEQENQDGGPVVGDVRHVVTEERTEPGGVTVELQSGVRGKVLEIHPDEG